MSRTNRRIVFIDGFAGPGRYAGGDEGSPLIALRTALDHRQRDPGCEFNFLFIEEHPERAANLQREIDFLRAERPFPEEFDYEVANEKFEEKVDGLLAGLAGARLAPTLAFIDPFGFEGLPMNLISRIAEHPKCECLITFMYESVNRFFEHPNPKIQRHLEDLFGTAEARSLLESVADPAERFRKITALYEGQLRTKARFRFVRTFTMVDSGGKVEY